MKLTIYISFLLPFCKFLAVDIKWFTLNQNVLCTIIVEILTVTMILSVRITNYSVCLWRMINEFFMRNSADVSRKAEDTYPTGAHGP